MKTITTIKTSLMIGVAATGLGAAMPALAAETTAAERDVIIVTARRVEEDLQDVPISITVFNQEQVTKRNINIASDLATYTPSLTVDQRFGPEKSNFSIRGFTQELSTAPTVGVYFAEVVGLRAQGGTTSGNSLLPGSFTDLENVQVLKGPQGTLFGRNTTGGAVLLTPKKPTDKLEGFIEGTYGNKDQVRVQGALNIPLTETFKVRISGDRSERDGFMKNLSGIGSRDFNDQEYTYLRLSIIGNFTPDIENYTIAHYSKSETKGFASRIIGCATPVSQGGDLITDRTQRGFSGTRLLQATSCAVQLARQNARGDSLRDIETRVQDPFLDIEQWQIINTTTWDVSDTLTLKNIISYGEFRERTNFDLGSSNFAVANVNGEGGFNLRNISPFFPPIVVPAGTPFDRIVLDTAGPGLYNAAQSTFTEELQIRGKALDGKLNYVVGGYIELARPIGFNQGRTAIFLDCVRPQNLDCKNPLLFGSISESSTKFDFDNNGVFGQGTYDFSDRFAVTAGFRYTFDRIRGLTNSTRASFGPQRFTGPGFADPLSGVTIFRACTDSFRHSDVRPDADRSGCNTRLTNKSNKPTWLINFDYKPNSDLLFYAKYSRGYRQGALNFTNPGVEISQPEQLDSFEAGAKASFRGAVSGYFNISGFFNDLNDQQVFANLIASPEGAASGVAGGAAIVNVGTSRSFGVEADASALFFDSLRLDVGYAFLDTNVQEVEPAALQGDGTPLGQRLVGTPFGQIVPRVQEGSRFTFAPKHRLTVTGTYTLPLDESIGEVSIGATWVYTSSIINDGAAPAMVNGIGFGVTPSTNLLNLNFDWRGIAGSPFDLAFFATNITKETFATNTTGAFGSAGVAEILVNPGRLFGARVRYTFNQ